MSRRRRSFEAGHKAKILLVADESPEFDRALVFAARRSARIGVGIVALAVVAPPEAQVWSGVGDIMREEAEAAAAGMISAAGERAKAVGGPGLEGVVRTGKPAEEIMRLIDQDEDIIALVLAAGSGAEGPGPLVSMLAGGAAATFPVPIMIVPGGLTDAEIEALA